MKITPEDLEMYIGELKDEEKSKARKEFINILAGHLFNSLQEDTFLQAKGKGRFIYNNKPLNEEMAVKLKEDAERFADSFLWKVLKEEVINNAKLRIFYRSQSMEDTLAGKLLLHFVEIIDNKIKEINS